MHGEHLLAIRGGKHIEDNECIHASSFYVPQNQSKLGANRISSISKIWTSLDDNNVMVMAVGLGNSTIILSSEWLTIVIMIVQFTIVIVAFG